jgi:hypothetical protein
MEGHFMSLDQNICQNCEHFFEGECLHPEATEYPNPNKKKCKLK